MDDMRKGGRQERKNRERAGVELEDGRRLYGTQYERPQLPEPREKKKHTMPYAVVSVFCLILTALIWLMLLPQFTGLRYTFFPNYAFTNQGVIELNDAVLHNHLTAIRQTFTDRLCEGIYIDGFDVSGLTVEEARKKLLDIPSEHGSEFAIRVRVGEKSYTIDSSQVPMTRDTEQQLMLAYAQGRTIEKGEGTPVQRRLAEITERKENPLHLSTTLSFDARYIRTLTDAIAAQTEKKPENAYVAAFDVSARTFLFGDDVPGLHLDADRLYASVMDCLGRGDYYGEIAVEPVSVIADVTKTELMNSFRQISSFTTSTTNDANRNTNIRLSCEAINGVMVGPGETFSFNQATGERSSAKGYKPATAISGGQNIEETGGGVCQTSSTLFNAVARADLEIVTRSPHAWPSKYVEKGMDATVDWPGLDFRFKNQTDWPVYIVASYANRKVTVEIYGMSLGDGTKIDLESKVTRTLEAPGGIKEVRNEKLKPGTRKTTVKARKGYVVETYQVWYQNNKEIRRELLCTSTYKAYQETVEYN